MQERCGRVPAHVAPVVGYLPRSKGEGVVNVLICAACFAECEARGFFVVYTSENEATAARRHDKVVEHLHEVAVRRRLYARALASGRVFDSLGAHNRDVREVLTSVVGDAEAVEYARAHLPHHLRAAGRPELAALVESEVTR